LLPIAGFKMRRTTLRAFLKSLQLSNQQLSYNFYR